MTGYYFLLKHCIKHSEVITVEDPIQHKKLVDFCRDVEGKVAYLPTGVDLATINELTEGGVRHRRELGFKEDDFILLSVNRFYKHKGLGYLIEAFRLIKQEIKNAKLVLVGEYGPYLPSVIKKIKEFRLLDDVKVVTSIPYRDLINYYAISDVYVSPLLIEGTSNSILDAMACGLPIVSTIMPWLVRNDVNGYIVPVANAKAIALAILKIYDKGTRETFGKMSKEIVKEYDWKNIAKKALSIYKTLI
jgi:glycosyltransferase involved in cell wall biosynthesis